MPFLNVQISSPASVQHLTKPITRALAAATHEVLGKDPAVTAIAVSFVPTNQWTIAGRSLDEHGKSAYWVDIKITDATNTKTEMARYITKVHAALRDILGNVHEESYVLVHAVAAAAYGYGGKTQEYRHVAGHTPAADGALEAAA